MVTCLCYTLVCSVFINLTRVRPGFEADMLPFTLGDVLIFDTPWPGVPQVNQLEYACGHPHSLR